MRIMIVDDHEDMRRTMRNIVQISTGSKAQITEFENGEQAVEQYGHQKPDLVLVDIQLATITGFEAAERIYEQDPEAKVLIVTSHDTASFRKKAKDLNVMGYITKDNLSQLKEYIEKITT